LRRPCRVTVLPLISAVPPVATALLVAAAAFSLHRRSALLVAVPGYRGIALPVAIIVTLDRTASAFTGLVPLNCTAPVAVAAAFSLHRRRAFLTAAALNRGASALTGLAPLNRIAPVAVAATLNGRSSFTSAAALDR
jgi:hypothetical protein